MGSHPDFTHFRKCVVASDQFVLQILGGEAKNSLLGVFFFLVKFIFLILLYIYKKLGV